MPAATMICFVFSDGPVLGGLAKAWGPNPIVMNTEMSKTAALIRCRRNDPALPTILPFKKLYNDDFSLKQGD